MKSTESIVIDGYDLLAEADRLRFADSRLGGRSLNRGNAVVAPEGVRHPDYSAIRTHQHTADWYQGFHRMVTSMPNIIEVHRLAGEVDYLIRAVVPDMASFDSMYREMISKVDLYDVSSSFSMETIKYTTALPLDHL